MRWSRLVRPTVVAVDAASAAGESLVADVIDDLLRRHAEPQRHYHTARHVDAVLRHVDAILAVDADLGADPVVDPVVDRDLVVAAALFHDAIYDPASATNEADSAALAVEQLARLGWSDGRCREVAVLIEATAGHEATTPAAAVLLDADLAVLGADADTYDEYVRNVRAEYAAVPDDAWRSGRSAVLRGFLERPHIFATPTMAAQREAQARRNLGSELASLQASNG